MMVFRAFCSMMAAALTFFAAIAVDRLAFALLMPVRSLDSPPSQGVLVWPGLSNLALVTACALLVFCVGATRLRNGRRGVPDAWLTMAYSVAAFLPVFVFALAVVCLRS